jgi:hypothetical protein
MTVSLKLEPRKRGEWRRTARRVSASRRAGANVAVGPSVPQAQTFLVCTWILNDRPDSGARTQVRAYDEEGKQRRRAIFNRLLALRIARRAGRVRRAELQFGHRGPASTDLASIFNLRV